MKFAFLISLFAMSFTALPASGSTPGLDDVGIDQHLGDRLPLDLPLRNESGRAVTLGDYFHGRPVIFTLVYFDCPMLCTQTLNQLTRSLNGLTENAGDRFDIVAVSIDPRDSLAAAAAKKKNYLRAYRRPGAEDGWHFLTADQPAIDRLTAAAGFRYRWEPAQEQFVHAAAVMIVTPDGTLSRYFLGVDYPPTEVHEALDAALRGVIGEPVEAVYFYCFRYDPVTGKYGLIIDRALKVMGMLAILAVGGLIVVSTYIVRRRDRLRAEVGIA